MIKLTCIIYSSVLMLFCVSFVALCQWLFCVLFYERFVEHPIQKFIDLCSTCNISMLLLESDIYGYYIHGQSVHGKAEAGLRQMHENMLREEVFTARFNYAGTKGAACQIIGGHIGIPCEHSPRFNPL